MENAVLFILIITGLVLIDATSKCPRDWAEFENECLMFSSARLSWHDAQGACRKQQAYLVTDDNSKKHDFIRQIISVLDGEKIKNFFLGASDQVFEGQWRWLETGVPLKGYTAWAVGQPTQNQTVAFNRNCMAYVWVDDDLFWSDWDCNDRHTHFICEKQAVDFQNTTQIIGR